MASHPAAKQKRGMGRGLAAILPESHGEDVGELLELPVDLIRPNPKQPRTKFDPEALAGLAASIGVSGVVQPLLVRPLPDGGYELIAGERRWRAAQLAGLERIPAVIREVSDEQASAMALIENIQREDLNPLEEAEALERLRNEFGLTQQQVADAAAHEVGLVPGLLEPADHRHGVRVERRREDQGVAVATGFGGHGCWAST